MNPNTLIEIAVAFSAASATWKNKKLSWAEFTKKLETPIIKDITFKAFKAMTKKEAHVIKDVGGYVGGYLRGGKRHPANVQYRQLLTLDVDFGTLDFWEAFAFVYSCEAVLHGTASHNDASPRYRLLLPLSREVAADEYTAIARKVAGNIGIEFFDNTTFEINRLMFWPTVCADVGYYIEKQAGQWLDADEVLGTYRDWRDVSEWPTNKQAGEDIKHKTDRQEDPLEKRGIVGAFCRAYGIEEAIEAFLSSKYEAGSEGRYTFAGGSTANGLVVYENKFSYSHHGTDPAGGQLCNAFDLVRLHKFGELDAAPNSLKSFKAMEAFALQDRPVKMILARELKEAFALDFDDESGAETKAETQAASDWLENMDMDQKGKIFLSSAKNIDLILENDERVKDLFAMNDFNGKPCLKHSAPWRKSKAEEPMKNVDFAGLRIFLEKSFGIVGKEKIKDCLDLELYRKSWHPIRDYLNGLIWDNVPRVDSVFVDYFGAKNSIYIREAARKTLCGAVARVMRPGVKFDSVTILIGDEGLYKSTFWKRLGKQWFSDSFFKVDGKDALEQIQGAWIIEIAELAGTRKGDAESVKHFFSKDKDEYRPAYGHVREEYPRQCIFVGTSNIWAVLKDPTGNRRMNPVTGDVAKSTKSVDLDLVGEEVNQLWAEAVFYYMQGEKLYLSPEAEVEAKAIRGGHMEVDERTGIVESFLAMPLPKDWSKRDIFDRQAFFSCFDFDALPAQGAPRTEVTVAEIWVEALNKRREDMVRYNTREINDALKALGWIFSGSVKNVPHYGRQRTFIKK
jgi:putative DNA primase/helicase